MMKLYKTTKQAVSFKSEGIKKFLNGLMSNAMDKPDNAFLNIHGRVIATVDQLQVHEDEYLIVIEQDYVDVLLEHLDRYLKIGGVTVEKLSKGVFHDLTDEYLPQEEEFAIAQPKGKLIITDKSPECVVSEQEYCLFRLENNIPVQGIDYTDQMLLNVSVQRFVSFTKGCFLGQEPISKVYNRSKPSWKLEVKYEDECSIEEKAKMSSKVQDPQDGRIKGFVFVKND